MTGTTARIRWEDKTPGDGDVYNVASIGYVGTFEESAFIIYPPDHVNCRWLLSIRLTAGSQFRYAGGPDDLKAEAERWLDEFTASLGAAFPEPGRVTVNEAALEAFIGEARAVWAQRDQEFCVGVAEYERSAAEFDVFVTALGINREAAPAAAGTETTDA